MKKLLIIIISSTVWIGNVFAGDAPTAADFDTGKTPNKSSFVIVTEKVPGANCECIDTDMAPGQVGPPAMTCSNPATRKFRCEVKSGFASFQEVLAALIRWVVFISTLLGVLSLAVLGVMWSMSGADSEKTKKVKGYFINIIIGLTILFFFRYILNFIAPWVYQ